MTVFEKDVIYENDIRNYTRKITKGFDILIITRIDYDDKINYKAVNDVRKAINIDKVMILYRYNRGSYYFKSDNSYYDVTQEYKNQGVMSIFTSLIVIINKVKDTYNIFDLGTRIYVRNKLQESHDLLGLMSLKFDSGDIKYIRVRQNYYGIYFHSLFIKNTLKKYKFNLTKFYGK